MRAEYFVSLFVVLIIVVVSFQLKPKREGFQSLRSGGPIPQTNLVEESQDTYNSKTAELLVPDQIASNNSIPYIDPSQEKTPYARLINIQTTLKGFLTNEASSIEELSDPSIQLPLTSAHSDLTRLNNEILVLKRNPGIESTLTQEDADEIEANLSYLQKKWRMSASTSTIEGFQVDTTASVSDLNDLVAKINSTITVLSASGTSDPNVSARIIVLNAIKSKVNDILTQVQTGIREENDIPILHNSYVEFLKVISNTNSALPRLQNSSKIGLSDLFPAYSSGDVSGAQLAQYLFDKYANVIFKGLSWDVNFRYTSEAEQQLATTLVNSLQSSFSVPPDMRGGFASSVSFLQDANQQQPNNQQPNNQQPNNQEPNNQQPNNQQPNNTQLSTTTQQSNKPAHFDWHTRSTDICNSITKQGLNPSDFGCLRPEDYVSEDFSWRGYAKMICSRLSTSYDTGLPESCGCPPVSWKGWRP